MSRDRNTGEDKRRAMVLCLSLWLKKETESTAKIWCTFFGRAGPKTQKSVGPNHALLPCSENPGGAAR